MLALFWFQQRNNLKHLTYSFASSFVTTFSLHSPPLGSSTFWIEASFWIYVYVSFDDLGHFAKWRLLHKPINSVEPSFYGSNSFYPWGHGLQFHAYKTYFSTQNHAIWFTHVATSISLDKTFRSFFLEFNSQGPFSLVDIVSFSYPLHPSMDHILTQLDVPTHFSWMDLCTFILSTLLEAFQALTFTFQSWCPYQHSVKLVLSCNKTFDFKSLGEIEQ